MPRLLRSIGPDRRQPKLEINPAFEWIGDAERERINASLLDMFGTEFAKVPTISSIPARGVEVGEGIVRLQGSEAASEEEKRQAQELANDLYL